jgi:hypothetical protein
MKIWKSMRSAEEGEGRGYDEDAVEGKRNKTRKTGRYVG